jgi:5-methylcytosine-specific restriction endonuclease McrA
MAKTKISSETRLLVEKRAGGRCEYCKASVLFMPHAFTIDHILPKKLGGTDDLSNLAYSCYGCNRSKYNKINAIDPFSQNETSIYNPRTQSWTDHFTWDRTLLES